MAGLNIWKSWVINKEPPQGEKNTFRHLYIFFNQHCRFNRSSFVVDLYNILGESSWHITIGGFLNDLRAIPYEMPMTYSQEKA